MAVSMFDARRALGIPRAFDAWQILVGADRAKRWFVAEVLRPALGNVVRPRVLELGSGTGALCRYMPETWEYVGIDISESYVADARKRFSGRTFLVGDVSEPGPTGLGSRRFDAVVVFGVLHHLDDVQASRALAGCAQLCAAEAVLLAVEPCWTGEEALPERWMKRLDRGGHIRNAEALSQLAENAFQERAVKLAGGKMAVPYTLGLLRCSQSLVAGVER